MKSIKVEQATWAKLARLKLDIPGIKTFDDAIDYLLKEKAK